MWYGVVFYFKKLDKKFAKLRKFASKLKKTIKKKNWVPVITADTEGTRKWGCKP
jgi:hypothetical protein